MKSLSSRTSKKVNIYDNLKKFILKYLILEKLKFQEYKMIINYILLLITW